MPRVAHTSFDRAREESPTVTKHIELKAFHAIWWSLAVLLPDLLGFATRDWRAAVAGAALGMVMIALSLRVSRQMAQVT